MTTYSEIPLDILRVIYEEFLEYKYRNGEFVLQISKIRKAPLLYLPIPKYNKVYESITRTYFWLVVVSLKNKHQNITILLCKKNYLYKDMKDVKTHVVCK